MKCIILTSRLITFFGICFIPLSVLSMESKFYLGAHAGQSFNLTRHLQDGDAHSKGSFGLSGGYYDKNSNLAVEISGFYTPHTLTQRFLGYASDFYSPQYVDRGYGYDGEFGINTRIDQLSWILSVKCVASSSQLFKPYFGIMVDYNMWMYSYQNRSYNSCQFNPGDFYCRDQGSTSHSINMGLNVGIDSQLNESLSIGFSMLLSLLPIYNSNDVNLSYSAFMAQQHRGFGNNFRQSYYGQDYGDQYSYFTIEQTNWLIISVNLKWYL